MRLSLRASLFLAVLFLVSVPALAQTSAEFEAAKGIDEKFRLDLGGFLQNFTTTVRIDSASLGIGTEVNLEDDLGLKGNQFNFRADGYWRLGRHARIDFTLLNWNRTASHVLEEDIQVGDDIFHAGASLDTALRVWDAEVYYSYSLINKPKTEAGLMIGVSTLVNTVSVEGQAAITGSGGSTATSFDRQSRSLVAPIPAVGAHFRYTLLPGFLFTARIKGFAATIGDVKGTLLDWKVALDWYPWKNVGIGAAWAQTQIKVENNGDPSARLDYKYEGPTGYISLVF